MLSNRYTQAAQMRTIACRLARASKGEPRRSWSFRVAFERLGREIMRCPQLSCIFLHSVPDRFAMHTNLFQILQVHCYEHHKATRNPRASTSNSSSKSSSMSSLVLFCGSQLLCWILGCQSREQVATCRDLLILMPKTYQHIIRNHKGYDNMISHSLG